MARARTRTRARMHEWRNESKWWGWEICQCPLNNWPSNILCASYSIKIGLKLIISHAWLKRYVGFCLVHIHVTLRNGQPHYTCMDTYGVTCVFFFNGQMAMHFLSSMEPFPDQPTILLPFCRLNLI